MQTNASSDDTPGIVADLLDVSGMDYAGRLTAAALQGLLNRDGPNLFLNYGIYDDPAARRTNEDFLPEDIWLEKYREYLGNQDLHNLEAYKAFYRLTIRTPELAGMSGLGEILAQHKDQVAGAVVWDPELPDTVNIAVMLAGQNNLLVIAPQQLNWAEKTGLSIQEDLRGRWKDRLGLYQWAFKELFTRCKPGQIACIEPGWGRPEFIDYVVQNKIFTYSLTSKANGKLFSLGQNLLMLLVGGPFGLRNLLFNLRFDGLFKNLGIGLMSLACPETRLAVRIQRAVKPEPLPTIFGWHTCRDDEFAIMLLLSATGLRLAPSHLASNFSFHSRLPARVPLKQKHLRPEEVQVERDKIYLTFTLSDGDQLMMMDTGELGNWRRPERGKVPFNWETQPMLAELAPALLGLFYASLTPNDYLIAGPSGAGYIIPPLNGDLDAYLSHTAETCRKADIRVVTSYIADPPLRTVRQHLHMPGDMIGFLAGYAHFGRTPQYTGNGRAFITNVHPTLEEISINSTALLESVRRTLEAPGPTPRFIGVHLFAYRTTVSDVYHFVQSLDPQRVKVVRADEFLLAAKAVLTNKID